MRRGGQGRWDEGHKERRGGCGGEGKRGDKEGKGSGEQGIKGIGYG